jgi:phosphatidylserine decarboxylase
VTLDRRVIAPEGRVPVLVGLAASVALLYLHWLPAVLAMSLTVLLAALMRDPGREIPSTPLAIVSPADGEIIAVETRQDRRLPGGVTAFRIRVRRFGSWALRAPVAGKVCSLPSDGNGCSRGFRLCTDEQDEVALLLYGPAHPAFLRPTASVRFGERIGKGKRCGVLRLAREVELLVPADSRILVASGDRVLGGSSVLAEFVHR